MHFQMKSKRKTRGSRNVTLINWVLTMFTLQSSSERIPGIIVFIKNVVAHIRIDAMCFLLNPQSGSTAGERCKIYRTENRR